MLLKPVNTDHARTCAAVRFRLCGQVAEAGGNDDQSRREVGTQFVQMKNFLGMIIISIAKDQPIPVRERYLGQIKRMSTKPAVPSSKMDRIRSRLFM
jgi:hypothetical protein